MDESAVQQFWSKVDVKDANECWPWMGWRSGADYGRVKSQGRSTGAHRIAYELTYGISPGALQVDHLCHNRPCCNPSHLRLATCKQNNENQAGAYRSCKSGHRGVYLQDGRWRAQVYHNGRKFHAGYYGTAHEAAEAARVKRLELFTHNNPKETAHA